MRRGQAHFSCRWRTSAGSSKSIVYIMYTIYWGLGCWYETFDLQYTKGRGYANSIGISFFVPFLKRVN
jgi:hypothetical protein